MFLASSSCQIRLLALLCISNLTYCITQKINLKVNEICISKNNQASYFAPPTLTYRRLFAFRAQLPQVVGRHCGWSCLATVTQLVSGTNDARRLHPPSSRNKTEHLGIPQYDLGAHVQLDKTLRSLNSLQYWHETILFYRHCPTSNKHVPLILICLLRFLLRLNIVITNSCF